MEFKEVIIKRRSIRKFKSDKIPKKDIYDIVYTASLAPSSHHTQMWRFIAITNQEILYRIKKAVENTIEEMITWPEAKGKEAMIKSIGLSLDFFVQAPVVFAVLIEPYHPTIDKILKDHGLSQEETELLRYHVDVQSVAAAIENLLLAATEKGYGTCWMGAPLIAAPKLKEILKIKKPWEIMAFVPMGISDQKIKAKKINKIETILKFIE